MERIAIFHPEGNFLNNPHLSSLVELLYNSGYLTDIFSWYREDISYQSEELPEYIRLFLLPRHYVFFELIERYVFIIGIDEGLIYAKNQAKYLGIKYAHISYELLFDDEIHKYYDLFNTKRKICAAAQDICFAILQDEKRAELYSIEYQVPKEKIILMPVSGLNIINYNKSYYLYSLLDIPNDKYILLHFGSLEQWSMTDWLIKYSSTMPNNWVLVLHGRYGPNEYSTNFNNNVYFTKKPFKTIKEMTPLIQSAHCCCALYKSNNKSHYTNKNIKYIGLSSGKFSLSLQHGIPVLVNNNNLLGNLVMKYNSGIAIDPEKLSNLNILNNLLDIPNINESCHTLFNEKLSLSIALPQLLDLINKNKKNPEINKIIIKNKSQLYYKIQDLIKKINLKYSIMLLFFLLKNIFFILINRMKKN